jgi:NADH:ubiquinone oxidoreductase subunit C
MVPSSVLIYTFFLLFLKLKIFLFIKIADNYGLISGSSVFFNLNWSEREISEMHNILFSDKNDSRHILLDYSFIGNPMKKNYSVIGYTEINYNSTTNCIEYTNLRVNEVISNF